MLEPHRGSPRLPPRGEQEPARRECLAKLLECIDGSGISHMIGDSREATVGVGLLSSGERGVDRRSAGSAGRGGSVARWTMRSSGGASWEVDAREA